MMITVNKQTNITTLIQRFPEWRREIGIMYRSHDRFRQICNDYDAALNALDICPDQADLCSATQMKAYRVKKYELEVQALRALVEQFVS